MSLPTPPLVAATHPFSSMPLVYDEIRAAEIKFVSLKLSGLSHGRLLEISRNLHKPLDDKDRNFARAAAFLASFLWNTRYQTELTIHMEKEVGGKFSCYTVPREQIGKRAILFAHFFHLHLKETSEGFDIGVPNWQTKDVRYIPST